jgi:6,7-dimethyl-8-ribityllumazine synthase
VPQKSPPQPRGDGSHHAGGMRFAVVASRFNDFVVERLIGGARDALLHLGASAADIELVRVPGAFEIPAVAKRLSTSGRFDGVICLGAVIRGATPHFDYVAGESARGVAEVARESPVPVIFGILTTETVEQAMDRAGAKEGNRGADAARAAVEMANLYRTLPPPAGAGSRGSLTVRSKARPRPSKARPRRSIRR